MRAYLLTLLLICVVPVTTDGWHFSGNSISITTIIQK